jgi:hypothetical protein
MTTARSRRLRLVSEELTSLARARIEGRTGVVGSDGAWAHATVQYSSGSTVTDRSGRVLMVDLSSFRSRSSKSGGGRRTRSTGSRALGRRGRARHYAATNEGQRPGGPRLARLTTGRQLSVQGSGGRRARRPRFGPRPLAAFPRLVERLVEAHAAYVPDGQTRGGVVLNPRTNRSSLISGLTAVLRSWEITSRQGTALAEVRRAQDRSIVQVEAQRRTARSSTTRPTRAGREASARGYTAAEGKVVEELARGACPRLNPVTGPVP